MRRAAYFFAAFLVSVVFCLSASAAPSPVADDAVSGNSKYDALLARLASGDSVSKNAASEDLPAGQEASGDADGESALDELMKSLRSANEPEVPPEEPGEPEDPALLFDGTPWGLEGRYVIIQEETGTLVPGETDRIRLVALRKSDGIYDRALLLEITPDGGEPFLIRFAEDIKGFESKFELKKFVASDRSEILLSLKSGFNRGPDGIGRFLIISIQNKKEKILYDSENVQLPVVLGKFFDDYRAEVIIRNSDTRALIDLFPRKRIYDRRRVYNENSGKLRSPINIRIGGCSLFQTLDKDGDGVCELRSVVDLSGAGRGDRVAYVDSTLKYQDGGWKIVDSWIAPAEDLRLMPLPVKVK